jgi:hypothetical protein
VLPVLPFAKWPAAIFELAQEGGIVHGFIFRLAKGNLATARGASRLAGSRSPA